MTTWKCLIAFLSAIAVPSAAQAAQTPVEIAMITTLSGPSAYLGQDIRDGFQLALDAEGGLLGGVPIVLHVEDDALKPGNGKQIADRYLGRGVKIFTGLVFSNVAQAVVPEIVDADALYLSPNAGPSGFAGKDCNKNYFVVSWQNDTQHEAAGELANANGYRTAFLIAPNYQAGRDGLAGFKRTFKGRVVGEIYTSLDQTDFSTEMAQVRAAKPDVVYQSHPGGLGISFLRQYEQAGLTQAVPMIVTEGAFDAVILKAIGEPALGLNVIGHWNADFENPANRQFVNAWAAKYQRPPTPYASQGYDTARLLASALKATGGNVADLPAFRSALRQAHFEAVRGAFSFGPNQHPVQDWYLLRVERDGDALKLLTKRRVFEKRGDVYAASCRM